MHDATKTRGQATDRAVVNRARSGGRPALHDALPRTRRAAPGLRVAACALGVACAALPPARAAEPARPFAWRRAAGSVLAEGKLYRGVVPPDVYGRCERFPADLRVIDADGRLCPHYVYRPTSSVRVEELRAQTLNRSRVEEALPFERVDLDIAPAEAARRHDRLRIDTGGGGAYLRRVEVFGADADDEAWATLARGYVVRGEGTDAAAANDTVRYPPSTYRRLRVHVFADARNADRPFSVRRVTVQRETGVPPERDPVPLEPAPDPEAPRAGVQALVFDTGHAALPVDRLELDALDAAFDRPVRVYGRDAEEDAPWGLLACGSVYRLDGRQQLAVELRGARTRFLRVELQHFDDAPLTGVTVAASAVPWYLVCEGRGEAASLYYGSEFAEPARFDLERRRGARVAAAEGEAIRWGPAEANPAFRPQRVELSRVVSIAVVALAAAVVLAVIVSMLRRQPAA